MKFAKELDQDLVPGENHTAAAAPTLLIAHPEWRIKYLDYKAGKKKVKAVARAVRSANVTPRFTGQQLLSAQSTYGTTFPATSRYKSSPLRKPDDDPPSPNAPTLNLDSRPDSESSSEDPIKPLMKTPPIHIQKQSPRAKDVGYGSFVPTPPSHSASFPLELPDPAVSPEAPVQGGPNDRLSPQRSASMSAPQSAYEAGNTITPPKHRTFAGLRKRLPEGRPLRRMFSSATPVTPSESKRMDVHLLAFDQVRAKEKEVFAWMDSELEKVETFYKLKEDEAGARLNILREQLHEMRNRRIQEIADAQHAKKIRKEEERHIFDFQGRRTGQSKDAPPPSRDKLHALYEPVDRVIGHAKAKALGPHPGSNSKALQNMHSPDMQIRAEDRDYVRRPRGNDVPYRTAKRKLKLAIQEFYRGMELLKEYALLNQKAFRKINKKYDKVVNARPPLRYMNEKVNKAWFVKSDVLDGHISATEDLYARYFERGNRKVATRKLRSSKRKPDQSGNAFRNGLLIGAGGVFSIQGIIYGADLLHHPDPIIQVQTSYLLQIYGGYLLALYLFSWFCLDCSIWTRNKINYQFVFEFDPRNDLDWRQLAEFPSFLILLLGLFVWINFSRYGSPEMFIYYPVILIFVTAAIIFFPGPLFFHRSRRWFVYSHVSTLLGYIPPANLLVAFTPGRIISRGVSRLLSGRHVLLPDILYECE